MIPIAVLQCLCGIPQASGKLLWREAGPTRACLASLWLSTISTRDVIASEGGTHFQIGVGPTVTLARMARTIAWRNVKYCCHPRTHAAP